MLVNHKTMMIDGEKANLYLTHFKWDDYFYVNEACYALIEDEEDLEDLTLFFFKVHRSHHRYIDWVINQSEFKDWYITKDAKEGLANGFKINWIGDYEEFLDAAKMIRITNEYWPRVYGRIKEARGSVEGRWIQAVLETSRFYNNVHTLSIDGTSSAARFAHSKTPINRYKEYVTCAV